MSDAIAPERLEALLRGEAGSDGRERRIGALLDELTLGEIAPPAELRERVRSLTVAPAEVVAVPRRRLRVPRLRLRLAPVLAIAAAACVLTGVVVTQTRTPARIATTADPNLKATDHELESAQSPVYSAVKGTPLTGSSGTGSLRAVPAPQTTGSAPLPDGTRAQDYSASLSLAVGSVAELSRSTQSVLDTVHQLGGAVETVQYGTPSQGRGSAVIDLRVPVGRAQEALRRFSALGTITAQQVQIRDLQTGLDQETNRARALRRRVELLKAKLLSPALTAVERALLEGRLADSQTALESVLRGVHATQQRAAFARFSLALATGRGTAVVPVSKPGAFENTADDALGVISVVGRGALFAAIVGGPFLLLIGGAWWLARRFRRRSARRLLESS